MSRKAQSRNNGYTPGKSLRRKAEVSDPENLRAAAAFVLACISSKLGIYAKQNETTGSLRLKIYDQDDTYEDTLGTSENWTITLGEFAEELDIAELYEAFERTTRQRPAQSHSAARKGPSAVSEPGSGPSVALEASEGP